MLVDLVEGHGFVLDKLGRINVFLLLELFAARHGPTMGQPTSGNGEAADGGLLDDAPGHEEVEAVDKAVGQLQGRVVVAQHHQHDQRDGRQGEGDGTDPLQQIILLSQMGS